MILPEATHGAGLLECICLTMGRPIDPTNQSVSSWMTHRQ